MVPESEAERLASYLLTNQNVAAILERAPRLKAKDWYLGAGCISQTVWNRIHGFSSEKSIKDYDLVYFDGSDLSYEAEDSVIRDGNSLFGDLGVKVEIRNQARVHLWYQNHFGMPFERLDGAGNALGAYLSVEDAIASWPTTATSVGVRMDGEERYVVYAPFGLDDVFNMIVRPNKRGVSKEVYQEKASRWKSLWPRLEVVPWELGPTYSADEKGAKDNLKGPSLRREA